MVNLPLIEIYIFSKKFIPLEVAYKIDALKQQIPGNPPLTYSLLMSIPLSPAR